MPLKELLAEGRLRPHKSSRREIRDLLQVADRDLKDAAVKAISIDLRFRTAYQAALQLATIVLASSGYRAIGQGHHWATFNVLPELLGREFQEIADYLDHCRGKRNPSDYDRAGEISEGEAVELLGEARKLREVVPGWLRRNHPALAPR